MASYVACECGSCDHAVEVPDIIRHCRYVSQYKGRPIDGRLFACEQGHWDGFVSAGSLALRRIPLKPSGMRPCPDYVPAEAPIDTVANRQEAGRLRALRNRARRKAERETAA